MAIWLCMRDGSKNDEHLRSLQNPQYRTKNILKKIIKYVLFDK